jgi:diguanylate cyclase (GGDEF)-like protein
VGDYVLLCDADRAQTLLYERILQEVSLEVVTVDDGALALEVLRARGAPALLVTELSLPSVDGFAVLQALAGRAPALVVSAFRMMRELALRRSLELGVTAVLPKTSGAAHLREAIIAGLDQQRLHQPSLEEAGSDEARLREIRELHLLDDSSFDTGLEQLVVETARRFSVPIALVSLTLADRQWFKAHVGLAGPLLAARGGPRRFSFCTHVVESRQPLVIPDARSHPVFVDNPLVTSGAVGSYAGAPLTTPRGEVIGTLCIITPEPRPIPRNQIDELLLLARRVGGEIEVRAQRIEKVRPPPPIEYLRVVLSTIDTGVLLVDHRSMIVFANEALSEMSGIPIEIITSMNLREWVQQNCNVFDDPREFLDKIRVLPDGPFSACEEFEIQRPRRRFIRWTARPVLLPDGVGHLGLYRDVTAERDLARQREELALTDPLTGLMNRRGGEHALRRELARARRASSALSLAMLDIDRFKEVNDQKGHAAGDRVLVEVGAALKSEARASDLAIRWGGEEFLLLFPGATVTQALAPLERVRAAVQSRAAVTLSAGLTALRAGDSGAVLVARADSLLYQAKDAGRDRVERDENA